MQVMWLAGDGGSPPTFSRGINISTTFMGADHVVAFDWNQVCPMPLRARRCLDGVGVGVGTGQVVVVSLVCALPRPRLPLPLTPCRVFHVLVQDGDQDLLVSNAYDDSVREN